MGHRAFIVAVVALLCVGATAVAVNPPPRPLQLVNDHWTPYTPPVEFPPGAEVYIIQPGDTLWDLARQFLGDPYLWPQIWEQNQYIRDAHWIYPGDPLVVGTSAQTAEPPAEEPATYPGEPAEALGADVVPGDESGLGEFVVVGSEDDVYCFGYLDEDENELQLTVVSGEKMQYQDTFATGDVVYISGGAEDGVAAGNEYFVVVPGPVLDHPETGARLGQLMRYTGHLRVLCTQAHSATAEILATCDPVELGSLLKPFEPIPIPMAVFTGRADRCDEPNDKPKGVILYAKDGVVTFGQDHVVVIDLGAADQLMPGAICTVYRNNPTEDMPRIILGEVAVLTTGEHWATAKITASDLPITVGDRVEIK